MTLVDLVLELHDHLVAAGVAHAFGGALALSYVAEPRGTVDVDINIFPSGDLDEALETFAELGLHPELDQSQWLPIAGIRLRRISDPFPVDVFPPLDAERYAEIERRCVHQPFGRESCLLPFLSAEDLTVFKLSFGRDKDWVDIRNICRARPDLDVDYIESQLIALRGPHMHPRLARLRRLLRPEER